MATSSADAAGTGELSGNDGGMTPAQRLQAQHEAAEKVKHITAEYHKASVEDVVDDTDLSEGKRKGAPAQAVADGDTNSRPKANGDSTEISETAKGKRKAQDGSTKANVLDTQSEELFPSLGGGPKAHPPTGAGAWGKQKATASPRIVLNGNMNGIPAVSSAISSGRSTPISGVATPASQTSHGFQRKNPPSMVSLPGRHTQQLILLMSEIDRSRGLQSVLDDIKRKLRVELQTRETVTQDHASLTFTVSGPAEQVKQAVSRISKELTPRQKIKIEVPSSVRMHIIGKGGKKVDEIMKRTGAKIMVGRADIAPTALEEDDSTAIVEIEGDAIATRSAREEITKIVDAHAVKSNLRLRNIPPEFFPFLAGPHNSLVKDMEQSKDVQITIPQFYIWQHQPPPRPSRPDERPKFVPHPDMNIQITGDRADVQEVRARIERLAEELRQQLMLKEQTFLRGQHQFIVGERGTSPHDFLQETGCVVILPPSHMDTEDVTIIGPPDKIAVGLEKATALAAELLSANVDPRKNITNAPNGADAHARALAQYFAAQGLEDEFQRVHNAHVAFPVSTDTSGNWDIFARDRMNLPKARADLVEIIRAHPPARLATVEVDPFFHPHLQEQCAHAVKNDFGVHMIIPQDEESNNVMLVYEGLEGGDASFRMPRQRPSDAEIAAFEEALHQARNQILSIIGDQGISTQQVEIPQKFHEKVRKYVGREQQSDPPSSFPVRVSFGEPSSRRQATRAAEPNAEASGANGAFLRGPSANVDDLRAKILAFIQEAERDELERGYTAMFEFPSKFNNYLIGKRGANINELRERFDVDINTTEDGKVVVKGPKAKADACKAHIISMGKKWEDEATYNLKIDPKFHRDLIGRQGEGVHRLQEKYNVQVRFPRSNNIGDDHSVADTSSEVGTPRHARPNQAPDEVIIRGPRQGADKARSDLLELYQYYKDNSYTATVSVAQKQIPLLMGRGGAEIDRLRTETNAHIDVPSIQDIKDSSGRVEIKIKGPKQAVEAAKIELQKRAKMFDDTFTKTIEVDKKHHQALIGAGGSNIRRIVREAGGPENSAKAVKFPVKESDSESIRIEGTESLVSSIVAAIEAFVSEKGNQVVDTIEVPIDKHRKLIGPGGGIRRSLEDQFRVSIEIPTNGSGRTAVKISGAKEDVSKAKAHISEMVKESKGETILVPLSAHHTIARNGNTFRKLKNDYNVAVDHGGQKPPPRPAAGVPTSRANGTAPLITDEPTNDVYSWQIVEPETTDSNGGTIPWILIGEVPEKLALAKAYIETALAAASQTAATGYLILPDPKSHRHVIGASGRTINAIRRRTGCDIQVPKAARGTGEEAIVITGEKASCEQAKDMILDAVRDGESQR